MGVITFKIALILQKTPLSLAVSTGLWKPKFKFRENLSRCIDLKKAFNTGIIWFNELINWFITFKIWSRLNFFFFFSFFFSFFFFFSLSSEGISRCMIRIFSQLILKLPLTSASCFWRYKVIWKGIKRIKSKISASIRIMAPIIV